MLFCLMHEMWRVKKALEALAQQVVRRSRSQAVLSAGAYAPQMLFGTSKEVLDCKLIFM